MTLYNFTDPYDLANWVTDHVMRAMSQQKDINYIDDYEIRDIDRQVNSFLFDDFLVAKDAARRIKDCIARYGVASVMDFCDITGARPDNPEEARKFKTIGWMNTDDVQKVSYDYRLNGYTIGMAPIKRLKGGQSGTEK